MASLPAVRVAVLAVAVSLLVFPGGCVDVMPIEVPDVLDAAEDSDDVLPASDDPDLNSADQKGPGLWDPLNSYHAYRQTHGLHGVKLELDSADEDKIDGEVAAMGVLSGHTLVRGTENTVDYMQQAVHQQTDGSDIGESVGNYARNRAVTSSTARANSLLLGKGTFTIEAASREDGPETESQMRDTQVFLQLEPGQLSSEDAQQAARHMQLDNQEASMVADEVDDRIHYHSGDIGEGALPPFPVGAPGGRSANEGCNDKAYEYICLHWRKLGRCNDPDTSKQCLKTCGRCNDAAGSDANGQFAPPKPKNPNDCAVSPWDWSTCSDQHDGEMSASREVVQPAKPGGVPCPSLITKQGCNTGGCHESCKTCSGTTAMDCLSCYDVRESVLNAPKTNNNKRTTFAWSPEERRHQMLIGEGGYQFKMLDIKKLTGQCVWDKDIRTEEIVSVDGKSKCQVGCDPPARMGNFTPGFACAKACTKSTWAFADVPDFQGGNSTSTGQPLYVFTGKALNPTCRMHKSLSCAPEREKGSTAPFSGDDKMKCTVRRTGRCVGVRSGTYKMHKTVESTGAARVQLLQREYNTEIANTCQYDPALDDYKGCRPGLQQEELEGAEAMMANQLNPNQSDKPLIDSLMEKAFKDGWTPLTLLDGIQYFVKFELDMDDTVEYGCLNNDACQSVATIE